MARHEKTYVAIEAATGTELFRGNLLQWDRFFAAAHSRLGKWEVREDSRAQKVVIFHPCSPEAAIAFSKRRSVLALAQASV